MINLKFRQVIAGGRHHPLTYSVPFEYYYEHKHETWEVMIVLSGNCNSTANDITHRMSQGDVMIMSPSHIHRYDIIGNKKIYEHRDIYIEDDAMKAVCDSLAAGLYDKLSSEEPSVFKIPNDVLMNLNRRLKALQTLESKQIMQEDIAIHHSIITYIIGIYIESLKRNNPSTYPEWLSNILIEINNPEIIAGGLEPIIAMSNYSHEHLCRLFKKYTGTKLITYFINKKMEHALTLLINTNFSILQIANEVGYSSLSFFIKTFKEHFGLPPVKYKKAFFEERQHADKN